jgi:hypothetical protein
VSHVGCLLKSFIGFSTHHSFSVTLCTLDFLRFLFYCKVKNYDRIHFSPVFLCEGTRPPFHLSKIHLCHTKTNPSPPGVSVSTHPSQVPCLKWCSRTVSNQFDRSPTNDDVRLVRIVRHYAKTSVVMVAHGEFHTVETCASRLRLSMMVNPCVSPVTTCSIHWFCTGTKDPLVGKNMKKFEGCPV